jgi:hypothetical protein
MTTLRKNLSAALAVALLLFATSSAALGQARGRDTTPAGRPCGDYYGAEDSYDCVPGVYQGIGRYICAYRTGPPCGAAHVPPRLRR